MNTADGLNTRNTRIYWQVAAVVLALICAGLIGVNLARWLDSRDDAGRSIPATSFGTGPTA